MLLIELHNPNIQSLIYKDIPPELYHLSKDANLKKLSPRIPKDVMNNENPFEENTIPRISFSESINGCILGLQLKESQFEKGICRFYVYQPAIVENTHLVSNYTINNKRLVFDSIITKEWWGLNSVHVKKIGIIEVQEKPFKTIEFTPLRIGDKKFLKPNGKLDTFQYNFKWVKQ
jgi:hypothetical protein